MGQFFRLGAHFTIRHEIFAEPDSETFLCWNLATGQNDLERPALTDDAGQTHRSAIDQGYAPAATVNPKVGVFLHHPEVTPQRKFHPSCYGGAGDGCNDRLIEFEPRWSQRPTRNFAAIAAGSCGRNIELSKRIILIERADVFQVPARTKGATFAIENGDARCVIGIKFKKSAGESIGGPRGGCE